MAPLSVRPDILRNSKPFHHFFADTINQYDDLKRIRKKCEESVFKGRIYAG